MLMRHDGIDPEIIEDVNIGTAATTLVYSIGVAAMLWAGRGGRQTLPVFYWVTIALIRSAGTAAGDFLAHSLHLPQSTLITGAVFIALIVYFYEVKRKSNTAGLSPVLG